MPNPIIKVNGISKRYKIGQIQGYKTLRDSLSRLFSLSPRGRGKGEGAENPDFIWALKNVSFEVQPGEIIGIIGRNGAGKSTLLKILTRITEPTEGTAELEGRVSSLLEVGTGFHQELTGRENIYLNGAILGMRKAEIDKKFDEIVAFSEVEKFIDTPVKRYSSGMYVRLAFAVAAHLEPEILLVDEVLAVGDAAFQKKCLGKMGDVAKEGRTVLFVSHNMHAITDLCSKCLWIDKGKIIQEGSSQQVALSYISSNQQRQTDGIITPAMHVDVTGDMYFRRITLLNKQNEPATTIFFNEPLQIQVEIEVFKTIEKTRFILAIEKLDGTLVSVFHHTDNPEAQLLDLQPGSYTFYMETKLPLMPGGYVIQLTTKPAPGFWGFGRSWGWVKRALEFYVEELSGNGQAALPIDSIIHVPSKWTIRPLIKPGI